MSTRSSLEKAFSQRTRKKNVVGEGKDFKRGGSVSGASASNDDFVNFGGGAKKVSNDYMNERTRKYMKRMVAEQKEIKSDPEKISRQREENERALKNIFGEFMDSAVYNEPIDQSNVFDYAQDYIPLDDKLGKASRENKNRNIARKRIRNNR